ncbi:MAG: sugar ABC transporter ATP-binding protein [Eubacteriales bacterium]|nr:sugar ABC transporter ATP-binding protein [Eubacteriales bacterium]
MSEANILEMHDISMHFPGVIALDHAQLSLRKGEVLGLIGENGAGKSTMMNILLGSLKPTNGEMVFKGKPYAPKSPSDALNAGISMIHQEVSLVPGMSVMENIWIGREKEFSRHGILDIKKRLQKTKKMMDELDVQIDPAKQVGQLSIATMQLVEVLRAVSYNSDVIIMDEPTSALTDVEIQKLYKIIRKLAANGTSIIYISHKLEELFDVCGRVTVFRDGRFIATKQIDEIDQKQLVSMVVGRELKDMYPKEKIDIGDTVFSCKNLRRADSFQDVSFEVHAGEILGFCGLMGAQRSEIMQSIFGLDPLDGGEIYLHGQKISNQNPGKAIQNHFALVTEDRLRRGGIHTLSIRLNLSLAFLKSVCKRGFVDNKAELEACRSMVGKMRIKLVSINDPFGSLSGGNQQKVIIGRWMLTKPDVLILDEPTRGVDVGAKAEIYRLIGQLAKEGKAIIMVSSELPELMGLSDRIIVVREGRLVASVPRDQFDQDRLMGYAFGVND